MDNDTIAPTEFDDCPAGSWHKASDDEDVSSASQSDNTLSVDDGDKSPPPAYNKPSIFTRGRDRSVLAERMASGTANGAFLTARPKTAMMSNPPSKRYPSHFPSSQIRENHKPFRPYREFRAPPRWSDDLAKVLEIQQLVQGGLQRNAEALMCHGREFRELKAQVDAQNEVLHLILDVVDRLDRRSLEDSTSSGSHGSDSGSAITFEDTKARYPFRQGDAVNDLEDAPRTCWEDSSREGGFQRNKRRRFNEAFDHVDDGQASAPASTHNYQDQPQGYYSGGDTQRRTNGDFVPRGGYRGRGRSQNSRYNNDAPIPHKARQYHSQHVHAYPPQHYASQRHGLEQQQPQQQRLAYMSPESDRAYEETTPAFVSAPHHTPSLSENTLKRRRQSYAEPAQENWDYSWRPAALTAPAIYSAPQNDAYADDGADYGYTQAAHPVPVRRMSTMGQYQRQPNFHQKQYTPRKPLYARIGGHALTA